MLITHSKVKYDYENYSRYNTRGLINCLESGVSNFYFREYKAPMTDGLARFIVKARAGIQFTPKKKLDILHSGNGLCSWRKFGTMKHMISCCMHKASLMTKRHNNVAKVVVQAIEASRRKELTKSSTGQYIHWNQEIRSSDDIRDPRIKSEALEEETARRRPDIWYYTKERKGNTSELFLNLIEITIPWNDAEINPEKFAREATNLPYKLSPFETIDVMSSTLNAARVKKEEKYKKIIKYADEWLKRNKEEIMLKYKVSDVGVKCNYVIISNLGIVPKATEGERHVRKNVAEENGKSVNQGLL
jgi:hypothetical protein